MRARSWAALIVAVVVAVWAGAGYLSTRPTDFHDYRTSAVGAARSAYDALATTGIVGRADLDGRLTGRYVDSTLDDARRAVAGAAKAFTDVAPPDPRSRALRDRLGPLLLAANTVLGEVRTAVRDGDRDGLRAAVAALEPLAKQLSSFIEEHR